jgi:hypothetical protein
LTSDYIANRGNGTKICRSIAAITLVVVLLAPALLFHSNPAFPLPGNGSNNLPVVAADNPRLNLTYYTATNPTEQPVSSGAWLSGDHVTLVASWTPALVVSSRLEVVAPAIPNAIAHEEADSLIELDTRALGNNATCIINSTAWLTNGTVMSIIFSSVFIGNFFVPKVTVTSPNGGEVWTGVNNITWTASDLNTAESLQFDVLISDNLGSTYTVLAQGIPQTHFEWNSTGLDMLHTYVVKVRVTDGIYFSEDRSDLPFTAGDVASTTSTSTTTTTTNGGLETRVLAFVIILLVSSAIMALIVYYAARKWF